MVDIKVLGLVCPNCIKLEKMYEEPLSELGLDGIIEKITTQADFDRLEVLLTPAIIINDKSRVQDKLPA